MNFHAKTYSPKELMHSIFAVVLACYIAIFTIQNPPSFGSYHTVNIEKTTGSFGTLSGKGITNEMLEHAPTTTDEVVALADEPKIISKDANNNSKVDTDGDGKWDITCAYAMNEFWKFNWVLGATAAYAAAGDCPDGMKRVDDAPKGGSLSGKKAETNSSDPEAIRGIDRENEAAEILSDNGYDIVQNPGTNAVGKNPDLTIDGEIYDVYSPSSNNPRNLGSAIEEKVSSGQTDNVVVNLADSNVTPEQLTQQLTNYPVEGLNNVVIIDNSGNVLPPITFD